MSSETIYLLVRADDIGMAHAVNQACIDTYQNGIMRSVELMPMCPWFPEAVKLLHENPQCDVGVHLALTSEWDNMKWRPLTQAKSLVTADGYFYHAYNKREAKWQGCKGPFAVAIGPFASERRCATLPSRT